MRLRLSIALDSCDVRASGSSSRHSSRQSLNYTMLGTIFLSVSEMSAPAQAEGAPLPNIGTLQDEGTPIEVLCGSWLRENEI
jgi:hypothetical protein